MKSTLFIVFFNYKSGALTIYINVITVPICVDIVNLVFTINIFIERAKDLRGDTNRAPVNLLELNKLTSSFAIIICENLNGDIDN